MKNRDLWKGLLVVFVLFAMSVSAIAQKTVAKPIIFAVLNDGKWLEPIAYVNKGKLSAPVDGGAEANLIAAFDKTYYKPGAVYGLIFGAANVGSVNVVSSNAKSDCAKNTAQITAKSAKVTLKGLVMGLATNVPLKSTTASYRRKPTDAEKVEIETLVKAEYAKQKLAPKTLHYQNLTALDVDNDGKAEFVGSYWVEVDKLTRGLLFFIASKGSNGRYAMGYRKYESIDQANVMSGDIKAVDDGVLNELLLDAFDYDGDGTAEIFTYTQSFEGAGFAVYKKNGAKWTQAFDGSNYHCGY